MNCACSRLQWSQAGNYFVKLKFTQRLWINRVLHLTLDSLNSDKVGLETLATLHHVHHVDAPHNVSTEERSKQQKHV